MSRTIDRENSLLRLRFAPKNKKIKRQSWASFQRMPLQEEKNYHAAVVLAQGIRETRTHGRNEESFLAIIYDPSGECSITGALRAIVTFKGTVQRKITGIESRIG